MTTTKTKPAPPWAKRMFRKPWRVGRSVGRTIYDVGDELIGVMDTPELAAWVVEAMNASTCEPHRCQPDCRPDDHNLGRYPPPAAAASPGRTAGRS